MENKLSYEQSFASHPQAIYWSNKNILKPENISKGSHKKCWFDCKCGHVFEQIIRLINSGSWCPYCANKQLCNKKSCKICYEKSFAYSDKSKYWSINNDLNPRQVFKSSGKKYFFDCECGHIFDKALDSINNDGWCPYCSNKKLCDIKDCKKCYEKSFASHEKAKYWSNKNTLKPRDVFKVSGKEYLFNCICKHEISKRLSCISNNGTWCPYCSIPTQKLCDINDCKQCYEKSFDSNEKAKYWSDKNKIKPREVIKNSNKLFFFNCNDCFHEFEMYPYDVIKGIWCYYCSGKRLCDKKDCKKCYEKSFASHEKSKYFYNNDVDSRNIFKITGKIYNFLCDCGHEFLSSISNITYGNQWCPYCSPSPKKLCNKELCNQCYNKSFASHEYVKWWSNENKLSAREVFKNSHSTYIFNCNKSHTFPSTVSSMTRGHGCPKCYNKTEEKLREKLIVLYPELQQQYRSKWCKNKTTDRYLPYDFFLGFCKLIIELDGPQHFRQISTWKSPEEQNKSDLYKMKCANENNFSVIRILQEDVYDDKFDWLNELKDNIEKIKKDKKVQNIYMCKNNEYESFKNIDFNKITDSDLSEENENINSDEELPSESQIELVKEVKLPLKEQKKEKPKKTLIKRSQSKPTEI